MASNTSQLTQEGVSLFLSESDFLNFSEITDSLLKTVEGIHEIVQCKTSIFMQKKEKHQQILDHQMMKLDNERKEYINRSETVMNEMGKAKSKLMQIEHSYFNLRNKVNLEKQLHQTGEEKIKQLQLDSERKNAKFYKTSELFKTVLSKYEKHLNIQINLDEENLKVVTVVFKETKKNFKGYPYVKVKIIEENEFQILKTHPSVEEDNKINKQIIQSHEIIPFLNKFRKNFMESY